MREYGKKESMEEKKESLGEKRERVRGKNASMGTRESVWGKD